MFTPKCPSEESLLTELRGWRRLHHPTDFLLVDAQTQQGSKGLFGWENSQKCLFPFNAYKTLNFC